MRTTPSPPGSDIGRTIVARWQDWSGQGTQHLELVMTAERILAEGTVLGTEAARHFAAHYRIELDRAWRVRHVTAGVLGEGRGLTLASDAAGRWQDGRGERLPMLDGAIDVDLSVTPFTNTLPIRRLALRTGQSVDLRVVYLRLPELALATDPQRYVCLETGRRFRYESLDSDFVRELDVDTDGLVITYPGLFRRVL